MRGTFGPPRTESGQVAVFVLGMTIVILAVAGVAVDGTRAFLLRRTLQNAADAAALAGANALNEDIYYATGGKEVRLDASAARATAVHWLTARGLSGSAVSADASGIRVIVRAEVPTTFLRLVRVHRIPVAVESVAQPVPGST